MGFRSISGVKEEQSQSESLALQLGDPDNNNPIYKGACQDDRLREWVWEGPWEYWWGEGGTGGGIGAGMPKLNY